MFAVFLPDAAVPRGTSTDMRLPFRSVSSTNMCLGSTLTIFTESSFEHDNKNIHSTNDRIDISPEFSFEHALHFSKLATAFAIELGGWAQ